MSDGNLRKLEIDNIKGCHWQPIETWSTGQGVPDVNGCIDGNEFWVENKKTSGWKVTSQEPEQVAWMERRIRNGGRCFIAVRRLVESGPRRGASCDELWVFPGYAIRPLFLFGMRGPSAPTPLLFSSGGPARWDWKRFRDLLAVR